MRLLLAVLALAATPVLAEERLVSLGGSVTEVVVALGAADRLVARDTTSNYPASILDLPDVGYIRALSAEGVLSVDPTMIIAEQGAGPVEAVEVLKAAGVPFLLIPGAPTPEGVLEKIDAVAAALDLPEAGATLHAEVAAGLEAAATRAESVAAPQRVLFILSLQGGRVMAGGEGSSAEGIIRLAGAENAATGFAGYKPMTDEAILAAAPDAILMMDREGDMTISDDDIRAHPALALSPAVREGRIIRMDGMLLLGFGPRTPEAAEALHARLYGAGG